VLEHGWGQALPPPIGEGGEGGAGGAEAGAVSEAAAIIRDFVARDAGFLQVRRSNCTVTH
jgi:hypothetical protein